MQKSKIKITIKNAKILATVLEIIGFVIITFFVSQFSINTGCWINTASGSKLYCLLQPTFVNKIIGYIGASLVFAGYMISLVVLAKNKS